jgi:peptide deformylase
LAAPQVGLSIRLFIIDTLQLKEERRKNEPGMVRVFINAEKVQEDGALGSFEEGCLSIPDVRGDVERPERLTLKFMDENFVEKTEVFTGINARVIQHEYDHIDGVLFVDHLKPLKKRMVQKRLDKIKVGMVDTDYKMKFAKV